MPVNILDVSNFQQYMYGNIQPANLLPIDWVKLKADPRKFSAVWCKCAEGVGPNYDPADYERQARGAENVDISAGPYGYWHYELDQVAQARTFYDGAKGYPGKLPPLIDAEDPKAIQLINESTTFAAKQYRAALVFKSLFKMAKETELVFGVKPVMYSGAWWWNVFVNLLMIKENPSNPTDQDKEYERVARLFEGYDGYSACYDERFKTVPASDETYFKFHCRFLREIAWQKGSTPKPPISGVGVWDNYKTPGGAVDYGEYLGDIASFNKWAHAHVSPIPEPEPVPEPTPTPVPGEMTAQEHMNWLIKWGGGKTQ